MKRRVKVATPISHRFIDKQQASRLIDLSDELEGRLSTINLGYDATLFHADIDITLKWEFEQKAELHTIINNFPNLSLLSLQSTRCYTQAHIIDGMFQPAGVFVDRLTMLENAKNNIEFLRELLDPSVRIAIENNNYYPTPAYEFVTDEEFICQIVTDSSIYLLLDIAHARVTAKNKNIKYSDYVRGLPLDRVIQLHLCSPDLDRQIAFDAHGPLEEFDYEEVRRLIGKCPELEYLTVEYYKDQDILEGCLKKVKMLVSENSLSN